jgi:uncharacterized protein YbjT (DUF2867 family)
MRKILIAGASGFIGRALIDFLLASDDISLIALSRYQRDSHHPRLKWLKCDLFSLRDIDEAMEGVEVGYYLVHSMLPSASLSQGRFYDFDLIMADNFIRAAQHHHLKHIIYLGGMIPKGEILSWHLRSRLEVEETLRSSSIKTTVLRAGLIIGPQGSSFTILERLIRRLPVMICPAWTRTLSQPIALKDVIKSLRRVLLSQELQGKIYDMGGPEIITYQGLIQKTAARIKKTRTLITLNIIPLWLSRYWVSLITGVPKDLVYPLVLSLRHEMLASGEYAYPYPEDLKTGLNQALDESLKYEERKSFQGFRPPERDVRSIQRLILPPGRSAEWVAQEYFNWLPRFFSTLIRVDVEGNRCTFFLLHPELKLLVLEKNPERSSTDRQLLYIVGGMLAGKQGRGRLEFREVLNGDYVMAAIHEFRPRLPWFIYRWTQALIHLLVMKGFGEHLKWHYISEKRVQR